MRRIDLTGQTFGRLTALRRDTGRDFWLWQCTCGSTKRIRAQPVKVGDTRSCGCLNREVSATRARNQTTHGMSNSKVYRAWRGMRNRCLNVNDRWFPYYGGRGIAICQRWDRFENFLDDMGEPAARLELDRIDNDGNYTPENCRWATRMQQINNRRITRTIEHRGRTQSIAAWARDTGLTRSCIVKRLDRGWSPGRALGFE